MFEKGGVALPVGLLEAHVRAKVVRVVKVEAAEVVEEGYPLRGRVQGQGWARGGEVGEHLDGEVGFFALNIKKVRSYGGKKNLGGKGELTAKRSLRVRFAKR